MKSEEGRSRLGLLVLSCFFMVVLLWPLLLVLVTTGGLCDGAFLFFLFLFSFSPFSSFVVVAVLLMIILMVMDVIMLLVSLLLLLFFLLFLCFCIGRGSSQHVGCTGYCRLIALRLVPL